MKFSIKDFSSKWDQIHNFQFNVSILFAERLILKKFKQMQECI